MNMNFLFVTLVIFSQFFLWSQVKPTVDGKDLQLKPANISFQSLIDKEDLTVRYHKLVNKGVNEILDGYHLDGLTTITNAISTSSFSLGVDWFMMAYANTFLNDKNATSKCLEESIFRDKGLIKLWQQPGAEYMFKDVYNKEEFETFTKKYKSSVKSRPEQELIDFLLEIEKQEQQLEALKRMLKDSIQVHHKSDKKLIRQHEEQITQKAQLIESLFAGVLETKAWPIQKLNPKAQENLKYDNSIDWFSKNESTLRSFLQTSVIHPWDYAFMHDWHARRHNLEQKYALFYNQKLTNQVIANCESIGMPWGNVRSVRLFYILP